MLTQLNWFHTSKANFFFQSLTIYSPDCGLNPQVISSSWLLLLKICTCFYCFLQSCCISCRSNGIELIIRSMFCWGYTVCCLLHLVLITVVAPHTVLSRLLSISLRNSNRPSFTPQKVNTLLKRRVSAVLIRCIRQRDIDLPTPQVIEAN